MNLHHIIILIIIITVTSCYGLICKSVDKEWAHFDVSTCKCDSSIKSTSTGSSIIEYAVYRPTLMQSITLTVNSSSGEGVVEFVLPEIPCWFSKYKVELRLLRNNNTTCKNFQPAQSVSESGELEFKEHSKRELKIVGLNHADDSQICTKKAKVHFYYIISGCYNVVVTPANDSNTKRQAESQPQDVVTDIDYKQVKLMGRNTSVARVTLGSGTVKTRFSLPEMPPGVRAGPMLVSQELRSQLDNRLGEFACSSSGKQHDCCVMREDSKNVACSRDVDTTEQKCSVENNTIDCTFFNLKAGNYCVLLSVQEDRCEHNSLWADPNSTDCLWTHEFTYVEATATGGPIIATTSRWTLWVCLGLVVAVIFVVLMYGLYHLLTMARPDLQEVVLNGIQDLGMDDHMERPLISGKERKLLLLYARDCAPFMDLMEALRNDLQKYCKCEVLDCYDEENQKEIFTRENDWLLGLMHRSSGLDLKVVLVATECAAAHQLAQSGCRSPVQYKEPDPCDKIFPLALKLLKEDVNPGLYNKINLAEFSNFKIENESPTLFPNPFTRFVLPMDFKELVCALLQLPSKDQVNLCEDDLKELNSLLDDLLQYKKDNPTYLQTIITAN